MSFIFSYKAVVCIHFIQSFQHPAGDCPALLQRFAEEKWRLRGDWEATAWHRTEKGATRIGVHPFFGFFFETTPFTVYSTVLLFQILQIKLQWIFKNSFFFFVCWVFPEVRVLEVGLLGPRIGCCWSSGCVLSKCSRKGCFRLLSFTAFWQCMRIFFFLPQSL